MCCLAMKTTVAPVLGCCGTAPAKKQHRLNSFEKNAGSSRKKAFVQHHALAVMIPSAKQCNIMRPDGSAQLTAGSCPFFDKPTFVRRSNRCQMQFERKFYEAFPGFCETYDERAVYGKNCDIVSFRGNGQELYDTCKLEWDRSKGLRIILLPRSFDETSLIWNQKNRETKYRGGTFAWKVGKRYKQWIRDCLILQESRLRHSREVGFAAYG
uniref:BPTI/Kunitz inhibitor domain-containing protein n=1 Tax=Romanomermis culicivorax TaxID=13658 RepID=A0A915IDP0_ROMCU